MGRKFGLKLLSFVYALSFTLGSWATVDRAQVNSWIDENPLLDPPAAGSIFTSKNIESLQPWLPPGLIDELDFPELSIKIQDYAFQANHPTYTEATEKFSGKVSLGQDGRLENYTAGQPFSLEIIKGKNPENAGYMIAWNNIHRWQYFGYKVEDLTMAYIGSESGPAPLSSEEGLIGGGKLDRLLNQSYHRVYLNNLAMLPNQNYKVDIKDSKTRFFKDYIEFFSPFNVKGTKFVVERMNDPTADDQVNTYLPTERRVRRFSAKERADSFMGSEATLDDFEGFSGRVLDYNWKLLGEKKILSVADTIQPKLTVYGPHSRVPDDEWQIRNCFIVEVTSDWEGHPYKSRILFIDKETFSVHFSLIFRQDNTLWKTMQTVHKAPSKNKTDIELSVPSWRGQINIDRYTNTATIVRGRSKTIHPNMQPRAIKRIFNVSSLTEGQ